MHPPRDPATRHSEPDTIKTSKRLVFQCGRAQRPSPTQRISFNKQSKGAVNRFSISSTARTNVAARRRVGHLPRWSKPTDRYQTTQSLPPTEAVIRRRFDAGKRNFETAYKHLVDSWAKFDNLGQEPILLDWGEN